MKAKRWLLYLGASLLLLSACGTKKEEVLTTEEGPLLRAAFSHGETHLLSSSYEEVIHGSDQTSCTYSAWKNDTVLVPFWVASLDSKETTVALSLSDFVSEEGNILPSSSASLGILEEVAVGMGKGNDASSDHTAIPDHVQPISSFTLESDSLQNGFIKIEVPEETLPGTYTSTLTIGQGTASIDLTLTLEILNLTLPSSSLTLNLWQYPVASARFFGIEPYSSEHLAYLEKELALYHTLGGNTLTVLLEEEPWGHQTYDPLPSMVEWIKHSDGSWSFEYSVMDTWIALGQSVGVADTLQCFSLVPWEGRIVYTDEATQSQQAMFLEPGSMDWSYFWGLFLDSFVNHVEENGWFDQITLALDERSVEEMIAVSELVQSHPNGQGKTLALSGAFNTEAVFTLEDTLLDQLADISLAQKITQAYPEETKAFVEHRNSLHLSTTLYTCTGNYPNSFGYSEPVENLWSIDYARSLGMTGFMRWALDAWNENPNENMDFDLYEAGDIYLLYPGTLAQGPETSIRLERIAQGLREITKLDFLLQHVTDPELLQEVKTTLGAFTPPASQINTEGATVAASEEAKAQVLQQVQALQTLLVKLTNAYLASQP